MIANALPSRAPAPAASAEKSLLFPDDAQFWFETQRAFGAAEYGGAQFGDVLVTSARIKAGDYDSWYDAWNATADRVAQEAADQLSRGHRISARDGYLRASNYYRTSEFFLHERPEDPRIARAYRRSVECYKICAGLFEPPIAAVEIPYEHTTLPGYLHRVDSSSRRLPFRPDWERVVTPVVDFILKQPGVDPERIALMGVSMGGELAPRAAAFEKRLAALIANDGLYDFAAPAFAAAPADQRADFKQMLKADQAPAMDQMLDGLMKASPTVRWALIHGMYAFGVSSPRAYIAATLAYNLAGGVAAQISCPTLVCEAEDDLFFKGQPQQLYDHLTCPKTMIRFTNAEGAGAHCQVGAGPLANARIFDWLDETLGCTPKRHVG